MLSQVSSKNKNIAVSYIFNGDAFWHQANQLGISSYGSLVSTYVQNYFSRDLFNYSFKIVNELGNDKKSKIPIAYIKKSMGDYELIIGRWRKIITSESDLSTGSLIQGNNSLPLPQISFQLPTYKQLKLFDFNFWLRAGLSHGWFSDKAYIRSPFLHEKYLYLKIPIKDHSSFSIGIVHDAMWGGETKQHGSLNQSFTDYFRVFIGQSASKNLYVGEQENVLGNHLGVWDLSFTRNKKSSIIKFYYQHPFEDKSGMYQYFFDQLKELRLPVKSFDGLWGVEMQTSYLRKVDKINIEYLNTMYQSGPEAATDSTYGMDNYFNHYIYRSGWTNHGRIISNPLFTIGDHPDSDFDGSYIKNNRIKALHIGLSGNFIENHDYKLFFTFSKNYGTYGDKSRYDNQKTKYIFSRGLNQFSGLIQINFRRLLPNLNGQISYAFDRGDLYDDKDSFFFSISYYIDNLSTSN